MAEAKQADNKVTTPIALLSYPHLDEPRADDRNALWYDCSLIFLPGTDLKTLKAAVVAAAARQFKCSTEEAVRMFKDGEIKNPFRKDWKKKGYPEGSEFFSCKSKSKPGIVGLAPGSDGKPAKYAGEIYAGLKVRATVRPYYYKQQGGGIAIGLGNIQVIGPSGMRFDSRTAAEDDFEADENAAVAESGDEMGDLL
jgi:hypothetical protein